MRDKIVKLTRNAENVTKDYVTISSIVITFVAGMVFSGSVLSNIDKVSIYRLTFVMLMIALFLFNLLSVLIGFIRKISQYGIDVSGESSVKNKDMTVIENINIAIIFMIIIDIVLWCIYWARFG